VPSSAIPTEGWLSPGEPAATGRIAQVRPVPEWKGPGTPGSRAAASRRVVAGDSRTWAAWSDPTVLGEVAAVAQADSLLSFVQVAVQDVADQDCVGQAGDTVVGVAPQVMRNQLDGGVGPASAAPDAGASISVFDRRGPSLQRGKGPAEVDCPQGLATAVQDVRGDPAVTPPTLQQRRGIAAPLSAVAGRAPGWSSISAALSVTLTCTGTFWLLPPRPCSR